MGPKEPECQITFRKSYIQLVETEFSITSYGCFICQKNFLSQSDYNYHIASHGRDEKIPASRQIEDAIPTFTITCERCAVTNLLNFTIRSKPNVSIEKIVIIRPRGRKLLHYIEKSEIQSSNYNRTYKTSVNCFLFDVAKKQPVFFVFCDSDDTSTRHLEKQLEMKLELPHNFPSQQVRSFHKVDYRVADIIQSNAIMRQYLLEKQLKPSNYAEILCILLQMEDHFIMSSYEKLNLTNRTINEYIKCEKYSFILQNLERKKVTHFLTEYDDIVVSDLTDTNNNYYDGVFEGPEKYFGCIDKLKKNEVYFSLRERDNVRFFPKITIPTQNRYNIRIYPGRIPFRYQYTAIERIKQYDYILKILFPTENKNDRVPDISIEFFNRSIENNPEQSQAVRNIVNGPNNSIPYILFGPPGTGKSTTIIESVLQLWKTNPKSKILVTSGSNAACDEVGKRLCNIFLELNATGYNLLRIYAASREKRMDNTEEILFESSNFGQYYDSSLDSINLFRIVVATLTTCGKLVHAAISDTHFTHIFIDECAASTESEALVGIAGLMGPDTKLILGGDAKQLGPVLKCIPAEKFGLGVSMMERLLGLQCYAVNPVTNEYDRSIQTILRRNFRTHNEILSISNELCYNSQLLACAKPELTNWVEGWKLLPSKDCPLIWHTVYGRTEKERGGTSSMNSAEIEVVMEYVREILENGINGRKVQQNDIGIISPYKKQYSEIRKKLKYKKWHNVETGSAETFQGQEKPIIIISTVKSRTSHLGFLGNIKRLNVMLTRPQALLIIVGNPKSLQKDENWRYVIKYCQEKKAFKDRFILLSNTIPVNHAPINDKRFNNNQTQYKRREGCQSENVNGAVIKRNTSQGIKKQLVSESTGAPLQRVNPLNHNMLSPSNKFVQITSTTKKAMDTTLNQCNSAKQEHIEIRHQANTAIKNVSEMTTYDIDDRPSACTSFSSLPERRVNPSPSTHSYQEIITERRKVVEHRENSLSPLRRMLRDLRISRRL